jgi:hypothetical protein
MEVKQGMCFDCMHFVSLGNELENAVRCVQTMKIVTTKLPS